MSIIVRRSKIRRVAPPPRMTEDEINAAIKKARSQRLRELHTVNKCKYDFIGSPWGGPSDTIEVWMETGWSLPLVIRGEAGHFNAGRWVMADVKAMP